MRHSHTRRLFLSAAAVLLAAAAAPASHWAFPGRGADDPSPHDAAAIVRLPGSPIAIRQADLHSMTRAVDWFPGAHPLAPPVVLRLRGEGAYPCGYCHLPDGRGRPENARLQGLPVDYLIAQVEAFASGARRAASPDYLPSRYMASVAHAVSPADIRAAAVYFSRFEPQAHLQIVEAATIPAATQWHFVYRFDNSRREPLGQRIVEGPIDPVRFELRDPGTRYIAYVPPGAIARGGNIALRGASGGPACVSCHGPALAGIAGASPTYLVRQLIGFRNGTRNDPGAKPMQAVAAQLTDLQIIDAAAYVASRRPWTHDEMPSQ